MLVTARPVSDVWRYLEAATTAFSEKASEHPQTLLSCLVTASILISPDQFLSSNQLVLMILIIFNHISHFVHSYSAADNFSRETFSRRLRSAFRYISWQQPNQLDIKLNLNSRLTQQQNLHQRGSVFVWWQETEAIRRFEKISQSRRRPLLGPSHGWEASAFTFKTLC